VGLGITAYTYGLRHAFDADHIAAIDNTTRKLRGEGRRPVPHQNVATRSDLRVSASRYAAR
jgi:high-affinity nickel permease